MASSRVHPSAPHPAEVAFVSIEDLYNNAPCGYHSLDERGVFVAVNDTELNWLGYAREDLVGRRAFRDLLTPASQADFDRNFPAFKRRGWVRDLEFDVVARDGHIVTVLLNATAVSDSSGRYVASRSTLTDISARKRAEIERDRVFTLSPDLLCIAGPDGYFKRVNPAFTRVLGWSADEMLARPFLDFVHLDDRDATLREVDRQVIAGELVLHFVNRYRHQNGSWRWLSWTSIPQADGLLYASARDVTALREAEEAVRTSDLRMAALLKDLNDIKAALDQHAIVTLTDPQGRITSANQKFTDVFEYPQEELLGQNHRLVNSGIHTKAFFADLWATIKHGRTWKGEICNRSKTGRIGWFDTTIVPFLGPDGSPVQFVSIQTDVTERKQAEEEVRRFNSELEALVQARTVELTDALAALGREKLFSDTIIDSVTGFFFVLDMQGRFVRWNTASLKVLGLTDEEMRSAHALSLVHESDVPMAAAKIAEALTDGYSEAEVRLVGRHGIRHALLSSRRTEIGGETYLVGAGVDISDHKAAEAAREQALTSLDATEDGVFTFDPASLRFSYVNQGALRQLGYSRDELSSMTPLELLPPDAAIWFRALVQEMLDGTVQTRQYTTRHRHRDGRDIPVEINLQFVHPSESEAPLFIAVVRDITDRQRAQDEILALNADLERRIAERTDEVEKARAAAEAANRAKSAFLANMSHEIRTPLNAISGMVELLEHTTDAGERGRMLRVTQESAKALAGIIDDILDLSKIEAGRFDVCLEPMSLRDVMTAVVEVFSSSASAKNLQLRLVCDDRLPPAVQCDSLRLRQILFNLVSNAIKFTTTGGIEIRGSLEEETAGTVRVRIDVTDTGIGISPEAQARIFQPFVQAEVDTTRKFGGTGLGLAISARLASLLGGSLTLESRPGHGTTVTLQLTVDLADAATLPARADLDQAALPALTADRVPTGSHRLLIVDDSTINRQVLLRQLATLGYTADEAANGREALDLWLERDYALIIADCHMPEMDGYTLARSIRSIEATNAGRASVPIVGYTANASKDSRSLCLEAGMNDALIKPVPLRALGRMVAQWIPEAPRPLAAASDQTAVLPETAGSQGPSVDWPHLLDITGGDPDFSRELLHTFVSAKAPEVAGLTAMLAAGDFDDIARAAHRLKGAARTVAAPSLARAFERIEQAARDGQRAPLVNAGPDLDAAFDRFVAYVREHHP